MSTKRLLRLMAGISLLGFSSLSMALPTTTLTGDVRYPNLDDLSVQVDISLAGAVSSWTANLDTLTNPLDSGAKLHAFFFNLYLDGQTFSLSNQPSDWVVSSPANNAQGSGSANFGFKLEDDNGPPKTDVVIGSPLTFDLTLDSGVSWTDAMFTGASITNDGAVQDGQVGAHIGGLRRGCSAFVVGTYGQSPLPTESTSNSEYCGSTVPEPSIIALFVLGLLGLGFARRSTHN
jgi:hypothetical protein